MYRYTAIFIILLISLYTALCITRYGREKISFHIAVIDFITYVKQQITFFCTPTNKLIEEYHDTKLRESGIFSSDGIEANVYLDARGKKLLKDFFARLGKSSAEDQIASCDYTIEGLNALLTEYRSDIPKKYKVYSTLTLIAGSMLLILLI